MLQNQFIARLSRAQPHVLVHVLGNPVFLFARLGLPGFGLGQKRLTKLAKRIGSIVAQGAASNFGVHVLEDVKESLAEPRSVSSTAPIAHLHTEDNDILTSQQGRALTLFLKQALQEAPDDRIQQLCASLIKMDLDLKTLAMAAKMNAVLLDRALSDDQYMCVNLRVGERLVLLHAAQNISDDQLSFKAEPIFKRAVRVITKVALLPSRVYGREPCQDRDVSAVGCNLSTSHGGHLSAEHTSSTSEEDMGTAEEQKDAEEIPGI